MSQASTSIKFGRSAGLSPGDLRLQTFVISLASVSIDEYRANLNLMLGGRRMLIQFNQFSMDELKRQNLV
jgi:hypothetical protein